MSTARATERDDSFRQFLAVSVALHVSLLLAMFVKNILSPSLIIDVPDSIRVDVVDLPDKVDNDAKPEVAPPEKKNEIVPPIPELKKTEPVKKEVVNLKKVQEKALEKIKALDALEKIKNEVTEKNEKSAKAKSAPTKTFKGNIVTSGNDFSGLSKLKVNEYLSKLKGQLRQHWELPQWLSNGTLKATVIIQIDERGYIVKNEIHVSSGNEVFDLQCIEAVKNSSPVDPPPAEIENAFITIRFPFE